MFHVYWNIILRDIIIKHQNVIVTAKNNTAHDDNVEL